MLDIEGIKSYAGKVVSVESAEYEIENIRTHGDAIALLAKAKIPPETDMKTEIKWQKYATKNYEEKSFRRYRTPDKSSCDAPSRAGANLPLVDQYTIGTFRNLDSECVENNNLPANNNNAKNTSKTVPILNLYLGFDSEWQEIGDSRKILSQQWAFRDKEGYMYVWILFHLTGKRYCFAKVIAWLLSDSKKVLGIDRLPYKVRIWLSLFNGLADLSIFSDRKKIYRQSDSIRNKLVTMEEPLKINIYDRNRNVKHRMKVYLRDCMLLAPAKVNLAKLGDTMKIPKVDIGDELKARMEELLATNTATYICYAAQDAVITLSWIEYIRKVMGDFIPITIGSNGARRIKQGIMELLGTNKGSDFDLVWRGIMHEITSFDARNRPVVKKVPLPSAITIINAATECYYGGRNECYFFGFNPSVFYDYDVVSAYPNAMCLLDDVDFNANVKFVNGDLRNVDFNYNDYLFARVKFEFPADTKFPCIPIRDNLGRGLIYPLSGECWASAPELKVALWAGAKVHALEGYIQPKHAGKRTLSVVESGLIRQRLKAKEEYGKGSVYEILLKELSNSGYGKMGQGLAGKRAFSSRESNMIDIGPSPITSSPHAALITALVRAAVSEAIIKLHKIGYITASVTTDGFLTNAPKEVMKAICSDGILKYFSENLLEMIGTCEVFELKHACEGVFCMKTRGQIGFKSYEGKEVPIAKAGYKPPKSKKEDIEYLAKCFLERDKNGLLNEFTQLPSMRECVLKDADYVGKRTKKRTYWDYDYKRIPNEDTILEFNVEIGGKAYKHVFFDTLPWKSFREFQVSAESVRRRREPVKTEQDARHAISLIKHLNDIHASGMNVYSSLQRTYAISILRGIRQGTLAADWIEGLSGKEICERVGDACGVKLTENDWKHAGRKDRKALGLAGAESYLEKLGLLWKIPMPNEQKIQNFSE